jgi:hypothetical protein
LQETSVRSDHRKTTVRRSDCATPMPQFISQGGWFGAADPNSISSFEPLDAKAVAKKTAKLHPQKERELTRHLLREPTKCLGRPCSSHIDYRCCCRRCLYRGLCLPGPTRTKGRRPLRQQKSLGDDSVFGASSLEQISAFLLQPLAKTTKYSLRMRLNCKAGAFDSTALRSVTNTPNRQCQVSVASSFLNVAGR